MSYPESYTPQNLYTIINTDPGGLGLTVLKGEVANGGIQSICTLLNGSTPNPITITSATKFQVMPVYGLIYRLVCIGGNGADGSTPLPAAIIAKWKAICEWVFAFDDGTTIQYSWVIDNPITDNVLTTAQAIGLGQRAGTWAEYYFGAGTIIQPADVQAALIAQ